MWHQIYVLVYKLFHCWPGMFLPITFQCTDYFWPWYHRLLYCIKGASWHVAPQWSNRMHDGKQEPGWERAELCFNVIRETGQPPKWTGLPITGGQLDWSPVQPGACIPAGIWCLVFHLSCPPWLLNSPGAERWALNCSEDTQTLLSAAFDEILVCSGLYVYISRLVGCFR